MSDARNLRPYEGEDFCVIHGREHMVTEMGNPIPFCTACAGEQTGRQGMNGRELCEIAASLRFLDRDVLEDAGVVRAGTKGDEDWIDFNDAPLRFIARLPRARADALARLVMDDKEGAD